MRARSNVRAASIFVLVVVTSCVAISACTDEGRNLGEPCIKDSDCISGQCIEAICTGPGSPLTGDGGAPPAPEDSGGDGSGSSSGVDSSSTGSSSSSSSGGSSSGGSSSGSSSGSVDSGKDAFNGVHVVDRLPA